jgi:branched-chain amino acid transport system substrate-binding protein
MTRIGVGFILFLTMLCTATMIFAQDSAQPISGDSVKIGVVTDLSGVNLDYGGPTAVVAAQMAAEDFGGKVKGKPIHVLALDHQNKADVASQKVRQWFDQEGVDMVTELLNSGVALAVAKIAAEKKRIAIVIGARLLA